MAKSLYKSPAQFKKEYQQYSKLVDKKRKTMTKSQAISKTDQQLMRAAAKKKWG